MALKVLVLAAEKEELIKKYDALRADRVELYQKRNALEDEILAIDSEDYENAANKMPEIEERVDDLVSQIEKIEKEIGLLEDEISIKDAEIEEEERKQSQIIKKPEERKEEKGELLKGMDNIVLRSKDKLVDKKNYSADDKTMSLGKYIRGMVTGKWDNAEIEKRELMTGGVNPLLPSPIMSSIIDTARNKSIFASANVPVVMMDTNSLSIAKVKKDLITHFKAEGQPALESTPLELEGVTLKSKTIYGYAYVSLEAINSAENLDAILRDSFSRAIAEGIDKGMLYGEYEDGEHKNYSPVGILNHEDINKFTAINSDYDDIIKGIGMIKAKNGVAEVMAFNAMTEEKLSVLKDKNGQYLTPPEAYNSVKKIVSNQLAYTVDGGSDVLIFDPSALLVGIQENITIKLFDSDTACIQKGMVCFRIMAMVDCVVLRPESICYITGFGKTNA